MSAPALLHQRLAADREAMLLYVYAFLVTATGLLAVGFATGAQFVQIILPVTLAGFVVSWVLSRAGVSQGLTTLAMIALGLLLWASGWDWVGLGIGPDSEVQLAASLALLAAWRSFLLFGRGDLLFSAVPSLAIFGLLASFVLDIRLLLLFLAFVAASLLMLGQEHHLRMRAETGSSIPADSPLRWHRVVGIGAYFAALMLTVLVISPPLQWLGARYNLPPLRLPEPSRPASGDFERSTLVTGNTMPVGNGPVNLGTGTVMWVASAQPRYWRNMVYETYTGHGWETSAAGWQERLLPPRWPTQGGRYLEQRYTLEVGVEGPLFAAASPVAAEATGGPARGRPFTCDERGVMRLGGGLGQGAQYRVVSFLPEPPRDLPALGPPPVAGAYLQVNPGALPLRSMAERVTASARTPLQKARAIEAFVRGHGRYNLHAPAVPPGEDAAVWFLTQSREGYCDLFATAMCILCRAVGLPARLATGFTEGVFDRERGAWRVDRQDAHAWPEVYLPGAGWTAFEPTPASGRNRGAAATTNTGASRRPGSPAWVLYLALACLLAGVLWLAWRWLAIRRLAGRPAPGPLGEVTAAYLACCRLLARLGLPRHPAQTPTEYLLALGRRAPSLGLPELVAPLARLTAVFTETRYAGRAPSPEEVATAREVLSELRGDYRRLWRTSRAGRRGRPLPQTTG